MRPQISGESHFLATGEKVFFSQAGGGMHPHQPVSAPGSSLTGMNKTSDEHFTGSRFYSGSAAVDDCASFSKYLEHSSTSGHVDYTRSRTDADEHRSATAY